MHALKKEGSNFALVRQSDLAQATSGKTVFGNLKESRRCVVEFEEDGSSRDIHVLAKIRNGRRRLVITPALLVTATKEDGMLVYTNSELDIHLFAETLSDLLDEIEEEVVFLWDEYACAEPEDLSPKAQELRLVILQRMKEIGNAA